MSKATKILSISVASYNLGKMIEDNLNSFCDERYIDDIEVLVVDDGSTDKTPEIVEKYVKKYPNSIKLIRQANNGPGSTVNTGIKNATGKYFRMVDGDDWVNQDDFAELIDYLKDVDVDAVFTNYVRYHNGRKELQEPTKPSNMIVGKVFDFADYKYDANPPIRMHNLIFRTDIMKKHVKLDKGFYTDAEYMLFPIPFVKTAIYYDLDIYVYRVAMPGQSTSPEKMRSNLTKHRLILDQLLAFYERNASKLEANVRDYLAHQVSDYVINHFDIIVLVNDRRDMTNDVKELFNEIKALHPDIFTYLKKDKKYRVTGGGSRVLTKLFSVYLCWRYRHL